MLKRHPSEDIFGVQVIHKIRDLNCKICGASLSTMTECAEILSNNISTDFIDINCGCPIDIIINRGAGSALLDKPKRVHKECINGLN